MDLNDNARNGRRMSERNRAIVLQHLVNQGYEPPFTEEMMEQGRQSYVTKARALKGGGAPSLDIPELVRLLEMCRNRCVAETESKRSQQTFQILTFISPLDKKTQDLERTETYELMTGNFGKEDEREVFGLRFGPGVTKLVSGAAHQLLKSVIIALKRAASRRLDDAEHWLTTASLPNHDPKFKLHNLALQDADLAKKRENQLRALQNAAATEKSRKTEKDDQMKQHDAEVQRVEEAHRQRLPSLETPARDAGGDDDSFERAAKQMKMMMMNKATKDSAPSKDTRYIDRRLCMEDLVFWLENDQHFRSTKVLLQMHMRLGAQKPTAAPTPAVAGEELLPSSKKRPLPN